MGVIMADKKPESIKTTADVLSKLIGGQFKEGKATKEDSVSQAEKYEVLPTDYPILNNDVLGTGGFPRGRLVEISGPTNIGKTTFCQNIVGQWQKRGFKILWVAAEEFDPYYGKKSGMDLRTRVQGCVNPIHFLEQKDFTDAYDLGARLESVIASNYYDAIIVDSVQAVNPAKVMEAEGGDLSMFDNYESSKFWGNFLRQLQGGFTAMFDGQYMENPDPPTEFVKGKFVKNKLVHRLSQKKTTVILLNHLKKGQGPFGVQYTPGGENKDFRFSHRIWLLVSKTNKLKSGEITYIDVKIITKKSKMGLPSGRLVIHRMQDGIFTEMGKSKEITSEEELENISLDDEFVPGTGNNSAIRGASADKTLTELPNLTPRQITEKEEKNE
jgi:recombination protein RecA